MSTEPITLALHQVPSTIRVEVSPGDFFDLDVITAQLAFESFAPNAQTPAEILPHVITYIATQSGHTITTAQAWDILVTVKAAFDLHKKKLRDSLMWASGSPVSTLFSTPPAPAVSPNSTFSSENSPASSPNEPSTNSSSTPPAPPSK